MRQVHTLKFGLFFFFFPMSFFFAQQIEVTFIVDIFIPVSAFQIQKWYSALIFCLKRYQNSIGIRHLFCPGMTSSDFLKVKINLKSQGNCKTEVATRCLGITCRVRHPFVHSFNTHITLLFLPVSCQGTYHLGLGSCVILPAGQCFILIWCPSELCQAGLHSFDFYLQSFLFSFTFLHSSVPLRKPHPIVTCLFYPYKIYRNHNMENISYSFLE